MCADALFLKKQCWELQHQQQQLLLSGVSAPWTLIKLFVVWSQNKMSHWIHPSTAGSGSALFKKKRKKKKKEEVRSLSDWELLLKVVQMSFEKIPCHPLPPLGPEDVLHFALKDLTFKHKEPVYLPVIGCYKPAEHHPEPVRWLCHSASTEPGQFSDTDM